jgi:ribose transport system permease protein
LRRPTVGRCELVPPAHKRPAWLDDLAILPGLVLLVIVFAATTNNFLTTSNIANVLSQSAVVGIAAIGATFVILTAGIDLSVGATIGASGVAAAAVMRNTGSVALGVAAGLLCGLCAGLLLGGLIGRLGLVPFVVTLAGLFLFTGVTLLVTEGATIAPLPLELDLIGFTTVLGLPMPALIAIVLFVAGQWTLTRTAWGRRLTLVGANPEAARISGVNLKNVVWSTYAVAGLLSGVAGVVLTSTLAAANASMGAPLLLDVIGAVVIGGTSLFGGRGSVLRTALGVLLLGTLANGLNLLGLESFDQQAVKGIVILTAAGIDVALHRRRA